MTRNKGTLALTGERKGEERREGLCCGFSVSSLRQQHVVYGVSETESDVSREMMSRESHFASMIRRFIGVEKSEIHLG